MHSSLDASRPSRSLVARRLYPELNLRKTIDGTYDLLTVFPFRLNVDNIAPCRLHVAVAQILAYKLDILGAAVNFRRDGPADVVGRFGGLYTGAAAKLPDPVVNRPDMGPFSLIPEEQVVLVRKAILFVDRNDLTDDGETHISQGEAARALKKTQYILMSNRSTLQKKDDDAASGRIIHKGSPLFKTEDIKRKSGYEAKYDTLLQENKLLFTLDLVKEKLSAAYTLADEARMAGAISDIMDICQATGNKHLLWFEKMLDTHFSGIIAHATYKISSGKIEGINQKIKTLRRHGYGYPDDEYFFLKIMDMSRKKYIRNEPSHRIYD